MGRDDFDRDEPPGKCEVDAARGYLRWAAGQPARTAAPPFLDARDHIAVAVLQGELASQYGDTGHAGPKDYESDDDIQGLTRWCYRVADAMLAAREGR